MMSEYSIRRCGDEYIIENLHNFNPSIIFDCGQCFRFTKKGKYWQGMSGHHFAKVKDIENDIILSCKQEDLRYWINYLDLSYDYEKAKLELSLDSVIKPLISLMPGMRLLNQDFFECLISFIISSNNNILRIRSIIDKLCARYGEKLDVGYSFPTPNSLALAAKADILTCGAGYRASYIIKTSQMITDGFDYNSLKQMSLKSAQETLTKFMGVGVKVADCVLLFSLGRKDAFPVDTWIRKVMHDICHEKLNDNRIREYAKKRFGENAGLANQYLFHYKRTKDAN